VDVERKTGRPPGRAHDDRAHTDVRHEVPVHHVDVDPVRPGGFYFLDGLAEPQEVCGENRGRKQVFSGHRRESYLSGMRLTSEWEARRLESGAGAPAQESRCIPGL